MLEATLRELKKGKHDLVFAAAAPSDYRPSKPAGRKISTRKEKTVDLELEATPKIIREIRLASPKSFLVAFKTEHGVSNEQLVSEAFEILSEKNADLVAAMMSRLREWGSRLTPTSCSLLTSGRR